MPELAWQEALDLNEAGGGKRMFTLNEVRRRLRVAPGTVVHWSKTGRIDFARTAGGHRRYPESEVLRIEREHKIGARWES